MKIVTVIPIARGIAKNTLTYFTKAEVSAGSIVSIPLRNKKSYGLVLESRDATEIKSELKSLSYSIRKVDKIETRAFLSDSFVKSCQEIADYNATSVGAVLSALIPKAILESSEKFSYEKREKPAGVYHETLLLQEADEERYATYKSLIREEFARNRSVFFCVPTTEDLQNAAMTLEKGIEKYTHTLHSGLSKKEIISTWQKILSETHPVLIIATGTFMSIPRDDVSTIILENENSRAYKMQTRPFLDIRAVAETIAKGSGVRLVLGDMFLRIETLWKQKTGKYAELSPIKFRSLTGAYTELANMRIPADLKKKEFAIFSDTLKKLLKNGAENNERTFLFCGRKGLSPITVCADCGTVVLCKNCNAPVVLYGKASTGQSDKNKNLFVCHHCGERRDAHELCAYCKSWRLLPLGIGVEKVAQELASLFPETVIVIMDKDHIATHKEATKARELFYSTPGAIMIGTEMALPYLKEKVENIGVISLDALFSIPDFRIQEKVFHILLSLRAIAEKNMIIQTRREDTKIFEYALRGNLIDFYRDEIEERKEMQYPPFATYVKLTLEGEKSAVKKQMTETAEILKPYELIVFDAWNTGSKTKYTMHGLISLAKEKWVDRDLLSKLRALPQAFSIKIDPDTLL